MRLRVIGVGRAGSSLLAALGDTEIHLLEPLRSGDDLAGAAAGADLVVLAVSDDAIGQVAAAIEPTSATVLHLSGATTLAPLSNHRSSGSVHPLASLTGGAEGASALRGAAMAVAASDDDAERRCLELVRALGGVPFSVAERHRSAYHATAAVAANHLTALCGQVERMAAASGVPADAFWPLMRGVLDNVSQAGAAASLTGPVSRGDWATVRRHLDAIAPDEHTLYLVLAEAAARLVGTTLPSDLTDHTTPHQP